jgi:hypothetical protein
MTLLDEEQPDLDKLRKMVEELEDEVKPFIPTWGYIIIFTIPAIATFCLMFFAAEQDMLFSGIVALAIMNGSINSIIAVLTIRLDGHSQDALDHLNTIMDEMDNLEEVLSDASTKVDTFTTDLEEARSLFRKIGMDLDELDLEPIADTVQQLKENKDGLNEVLSHLRDVDVKEYIDQAKRIDWKEMLGAAEEIMGFIKSKNDSEERMNNFKAVPIPEMDFSQYEDRDEFFTQPVEENEVYEDEDDYFDDDEDFAYEEPTVVEPEKIVEEEPKLVLTPPKRKRPNLNLAPPKRS